MIGAGSEPIATPAAWRGDVDPLRLDDDGDVLEVDPGDLVLTCASCGARMDERRCKLVCRCGYFASCSDYC